MPLPGLFLSFALELMDDVIRSVPNLLAKYERRRARFLEEESELLFVSAFPSAKVYRRSLWHDPTTEKDFENDLLVLIDSYQIIVEAKSGKVSAPARRGAISSLEKEIKELIVEPSLQAMRFAEYLQSNRGKHKFKTLAGNVNEVDNTDCHETIATDQGKRGAITVLSDYRQQRQKRRHKFVTKEKRQALQPAASHRK